MAYHNIGGAFGIPNIVSNAKLGYAGPNIQFTPEPATMVLLAVGGLIGLRRRRTA